VIGLVSLDADNLVCRRHVARGSCAIAGLVAWVALSIVWLRDGARGLRMASRRWWLLLGLGVLAGLPCWRWRCTPSLASVLAVRRAVPAGAHRYVDPPAAAC
jgi:hypothetical protein